MADGMLSPYRVLDLTDESGFLTGRILADLGADVIKVEPPGGDPARRIAPYYHDEPDPEKSLYWFAFNANKRGVTIDLEAPEGREQFAALAATADIVVESFAPGRMDALGFGFDALRRINPRCILVSISPFGQTGPYRDYKAPDIVAWALGGHMSICGPPEGPPYHVSHHSLACLLAGGDAAVGAMVALHQRLRSGRGQHVDVAIRDSVVQSTYQILATWDMQGVNRLMGQRPLALNFPWTWPCQDGHVVNVIWSGNRGNERTGPLFAWMAAEGFEDPLVTAIDWELLTVDTITQEVFDAVVNLTSRFFRSHTKTEIYEWSMGAGMGIIPVQNAADLAVSPQLLARDFWQPLEHDDLGEQLTYPGPWAVGHGAPPTLRRRAPLIGEHNAEILPALASSAPAAAETAPPPVAPDSKPLAGIKVLDFGWFMTGPVTTRPLADYGATVVTIESVTRPDSIRLVGPHKDGVFGVNRGGDHAQRRTSHLGITLNLRSEEGKAVARRLVAWADIVFDNFGADVMQRMGFGDEDLRAIKPDIIVLTCSGQGETGPHRAVKGGGTHFVALAGLHHLSGQPDEPPQDVSVLTDFISPRFNTTLLLAAVDHQRRTGRGGYYDVSQFEAAVTLTAPLMLDHFANDRVPWRLGNRHVAAAPHGAYPCSGDRWCTIAVFSDDEWRAFVRVIGSPPWTHDPRFATLAGRKQHEDELDRHIRTWTRSRRPDEVTRLLQDAGVPAGEVARGEELMDWDPQLAHRGFWQTLEHPDIGPYRALAHAFRLSDAPLQMRPAHMIGQHTAEILRDILGMDDEEIADLSACGALE